MGANDLNRTERGSAGSTLGFYEREINPGATALGSVSDLSRPSLQDYTDENIPCKLCNPWLLL